MALPSYYDTGTASVTNGATTITGQGTAWDSAGLQPGDWFIGADGRLVPIASVDGPTSLTLAVPWPGATQAAATYQIMRTPDIVRFQEAERQLLETLTNGTLAALATAGSGTNKISYWTGVGVAALADFKAAGRALVGLTAANGKIPVFTGATTAAARDIKGTVSQSGGVPTGALFEQGSNANGEYARFAGGAQMCWGKAVATYANGNFVNATWLFPAAFAAEPIISALMDTDSAPLAPSRSDLTPVFWDSIGAPTTSTRLEVRRTIGSSTAFAEGNEITLLAIATGRWF